MIVTEGKFAKHVTEAMEIAVLHIFTLKKKEVFISVTHVSLLHNPSMYTAFADSQPRRLMKSKHTTAYRTLTVERVHVQIWYSHCFTPEEAGNIHKNQVSSAASSPTSALEKKGNKVIAGDSFHWEILTILTTRYEAEVSCVMFTFCTSLLGSYGFYRSTIT